ncbi:DUF3397 family protein [Chungangia koreensis]|uniref:DUF3397 family protein n=1 Tax=Chungangia koreensis TaxID=752657 RepID=A0ABV8X197_9LACT
MGEISTGIVSFLIAFPIVLFILFYVLLYLLFRKKKMDAFGIAADVTTLILFWSVPAVVYVFWTLNIFSYLIISALLIGMIFTIFEWKTQKEVLVIPLLRKIWRSLFLILNVLYVGAFIAGAVQFILHYMS